MFNSYNYVPNKTYIINENTNVGLMGQRIIMLQESDIEINTNKILLNYKNQEFIFDIETKQNFNDSYIFKLKDFLLVIPKNKFIN